MGVLGLWQLLAPVGQPVTLESLENKIFAVDISIWLNQAVKGYRDSQGGSVPNAHLLSLFSRLCKLLFYRIRPIIVFDGGFPELKKQTIINRQQRRAAVKQNSREVGLKVLTNYLASQQLGQTSIAPSTSKVTFKHKEKPRDEIFKLPPLPESSQKFLSDSQEDNEDTERKFTNFTREDIKYLNKIDIESEDFDNLPPDVKQEILSTLKESRRHRTWDQYDELPKESNDFSNYQMQCLLKKRKLQSKLEEVQKDLRKINSSAYVSQYTNDHVIGETNKIMSDDTSYYVLLKKIVDKKENASEKQSLDEKPSVSVMAHTKSAFIRDIENIDVDDDADDDLNMAILNSLSDTDVKNVSVRDIENIDADDDLNQAISNSLSDTVNEEKRSLNLSDEDCDVDDPPLRDITKDKCIQNNDQVADLCTIEHNLIASTSDQSSFIGQTSIKSSPKDQVQINVKDISKKYVDKSESEVEILPLEEDIECMKEGEESVFISSDDEMIPCEKEDSNNLFPDIDQLENVTNLESEVSPNKDTFPKQNIRHVGGTTFDEIPSVSEYSNESILGKDISIELPSTSHFDSPKILDKDLQKANLELQNDLETAAAILEADQAKQDRQARTVQDHMVEECKELLQLFGIPYIVSPLEAEAQCAFYDKVDLTHGTITDDSDVWLFGGKRVYKNFFTQQKFVESFKDKEIFTHFGLSREKLINFALLTGSDYTEGIEGVGPVTAMEIISEFPGEGIEALKKFKNWWDDTTKHTRTPENKVRAKLRKLTLYHNFPDEKVFDAYLDPEVDSSTEKFTWGRPDLDALREYTKERFGWNQGKVDDALLPVLKKLNERNSQMHIDSFFTVTLKKDKNLFPSKRIMSALKKITSPQKQETISKAENKPNKRKVRTSQKVVPKKINKKTVLARGSKSNFKSQAPALSESSSDSEC